MTPPLLRMTDISKSYPGVRALEDVDLELHAGEVLALIGENGAGKSTLIKILGGAHACDSGEIQIAGETIRLASPHVSQRAGIGVIYQEFNLVPAMTARENIFLGQESRLRFLRTHEEHHRATQLFESLGVPVEPEALCRNLSVAQQQAVEIAKALALNAKIIIMDEPSAALSPREVKGLMAIIHELKSRGLGIIYVSHRLNEVQEVADRVMILRDGKHVETRLTDEMPRELMIERMVGRKLEEEFPKQTASLGEPRLVVSNLSRGRKVQEVSFTVHSGEVLGLTGLVGAGRTETARLIFGADRRDSGSISLDGAEISIRRPGQAIAGGICLLTEDRKSQGLVLGHSVQHNYALPNLSRFTRWGFLSPTRERRALNGYIDQLKIKLKGPGQRVETLSGGNQQKVVLAKWLEQNAKVIIFDEPTRGIDVGAKVEIYQLINRLAAQGKAILMISSDLAEVLGMADRILVMHEGRITGELTDVASATQEQIMDLAVM